MVLLPKAKFARMIIKDQGEVSGAGSIHAERFIGLAA
jgi:hypothetical protein